MLRFDRFYPLVQIVIVFIMKLLFNLTFVSIHSCPLSPVVSKASSGVMEIYDVYAAMDMLAFLQVSVL